MPGTLDVWLLSPQTATLPIPSQLYSVQEWILRHLEDS